MPEAGHSELLFSHVSVPYRKETLVSPVPGRSRRGHERGLSAPFLALFYRIVGYKDGIRRVWLANLSMLLGTLVCPLSIARDMFSL
jgi:hypothetical protein